LCNGHGDVTSLRDTTELLRNAYDYDVFGNPVASATKYFNTAGQLTTSTGKGTARYVIQVISMTVRQGSTI